MYVYSLLGLDWLWPKPKFFITEFLSKHQTHQSLLCFPIMESSKVHLHKQDFIYDPESSIYNGFIGIFDWTRKCIGKMPSKVLFWSNRYFKYMDLLFGMLLIDCQLVKLIILSEVCYLNSLPTCVHVCMRVFASSKATCQLGFRNLYGCMLTFAESGSRYSHGRYSK